MISSAGLTNLGLYRWLIKALQQAYERGDEDQANYLEERMLKLRGRLTEAERAELEG